MKRSSMVLLGATGLLVAGAWLGRSSPPPAEEKAEIYDNVEACIAANVLPRDKCETEFNAARNRHLTEAPRFSSQNSCESQYGAGRCQSAMLGGVTQFIPVMAGLLIAQRLSGGAQAGQALLPPLASQQSCAPGYTPQTQPGCVMRSSNSNWRSFSTSSGASYSSSRGSTVAIPGGHVSRSSTAGGASASSSVSRGGFGSTASSSSRGSSS